MQTYPVNLRSGDVIVWANATRTVDHVSSAQAVAWRDSNTVRMHFTDGTTALVNGYRAVDVVAGNRFRCGSCYSGLPATERCVCETRHCANCVEDHRRYCRTYQRTVKAETSAEFVCPACGAEGETQCDNCDEGIGCCCECYECTNCGGRTEEICSDCERCGDCGCECAEDACTYCGNDREGFDCRYCDRCRSCCGHADSTPLSPSDLPCKYCRYTSSGCSQAGHHCETNSCTRYPSRWCATHGRCECATHDCKRGSTARGALDCRYCRKTPCPGTHICDVPGCSYSSKGAYYCADHDRAECSEHHCRTTSKAVHCPSCGRSRTGIAWCRTHKRYECPGSHPIV